MSGSKAAVRLQLVQCQPCGFNGSLESEATGMFSRKCARCDCKRLAFDGHRYCCKECRHGCGHGGGCSDRQRFGQGPGDPPAPAFDGSRDKSNVPPCVLHAWRSRWLSAGPKARALIELVSLHVTEQNGSASDPRKFIRRLVLNFHPDTAGESASNMECTQFLNAALEEF